MAVLVDASAKAACQDHSVSPGPEDRIRQQSGASGVRRHRIGLPRLAALFLAMTALAACDAPVAGTSVAASPPGLRSSPYAGPGPAPISVARARAVFSTLCVATGGARKPTEAAAAADGFVRNSQTGTFYHPRDNLSVKLIEGDCSMVFGSNVPEAQLRSALTTLNNGSPPIRWRGEFLGLYNVRIAIR